MRNGETSLDDAYSTIHCPFFTIYMVLIVAVYRYGHYRMLALSFDRW